MRDGRKGQERRQQGLGKKKTGKARDGEDEESQVKEELPDQG